MADSQKMGKASSGGQRIDSHEFWAGSGNKESPFPKGVHTKSVSSAEGAADLMKYEDTTEAIKATQMAAKAKAKAHSMKMPNRN